MSLVTSEPTALCPSRKAIIALVLGVLLPPGGLVLALFALKEHGRTGSGRGKGLALAAVAVSLAVMGLLVVGALAAPGFVRFPCRSMQAEAKANLKSALVALETHRAAHGAYASLEEVGFRPLGEVQRYRYELVEHGPDGFVVRASATSPELEGDIWEITQDNVLSHVSEGCR